MILKVIVCMALIFWASRSGKPLMPSLIYGGLTYSAGTMAQMSGIKTSNLFIVSGIGFALCFCLFWLMTKSTNAFLKGFGILLTLAVIVLYPIDLAMLKSMKS